MRTNNRGITVVPASNTGYCLDWSPLFRVGGCVRMHGGISHKRWLQLATLWVFVDIFGGKRRVVHTVTSFRMELDPVVYLPPNSMHGSVMLRCSHVPCCTTGFVDMAVSFVMCFITYAWESLLTENLCNLKHSRLVDRTLGVFIDILLNFMVRIILN